METEIEIKFYVTNADLPRIRKDIGRMGARYTGKDFETNILFETKEKTLSSRNAILRLRQGSKNTLCYKEPLHLGKVSQQFKVKEEIELGVDDFQKARAILKKLGFHELMTYERKRETFHFGESKILIDEMPFGFFLEIEGSGEDIRSIVDKLGLDWRKRIRKSYLEIFEDLRQRVDLSFRDLTFKNFGKIDMKGLDFDNFISSYWEKTPADSGKNVV